MQKIFENQADKLSNLKNLLKLKNKKSFSTLGISVNFENMPATPPPVNTKKRKRNRWKMKQEQEDTDANDSKTNNDSITRMEVVVQNNDDDFQSERKSVKD